MERYNLAFLTKEIYNSGFKLFSLKTLREVLAIEKESTLFKVVKNLLENEVLIKIERGKYLLKESKVSDFALANFIYQPSYISFESALNFYGIFSQFPYEVTSATSKKTKEKIFQGKVFTFTHIKKELFWAYQKKQDFIIAFPEKALLDQLYLTVKGYKRANLDEYNLEGLDVFRLKEYFKRYPKTRQCEKMAESIKKYVKI